MTRVAIITNPFDPWRGFQRYDEPERLTVRQFLRKVFGKDFVEFARPTICQINGTPVLRRDWDEQRFAPGDIVVFAELPAGTAAIIIAVLAVVVAVAVVMLVETPQVPGEMSDPDPVYTLRGQTNRLRLGEPIEVHYGRVRIFPSYAAPPYSRYINNDSFQYSLFCIGQGEFDIENLYIDDTLLANYDEVTYEVIPPGDAITLFDSSVYQAIEVSNIELLGPNQAEYSGPSGGFVLNPAGSTVTRVEVDISFPQGLYGVHSDGGRYGYTVGFKFQVREIDAEGVAVGAWTTIVDTTFRGKSNTPQRLTYSADVTAARYEIRGERTTNKSNSTKVVDTLYWEAAKGFVVLEQDFGDRTLLAVKAKATNSLNNQTRGRINLFATRKLPIYDELHESWGSLAATRNPVDAFCDVFRSTYGANLSDEYLDMPSLMELRSQFEDEECWFDWTFDTGMSIWEAAKMIMKVGRSVPVPQGSVVSAVRDLPATVPAAVFNQHNIVAGSLKKSLAMYEFQPDDCVYVEYTDPDTWKPEEVLAVLPHRTTDFPEKVKLPGCTDRTKAYQWGLYLRSVREYQRKTVTFRTGLEGHIPSFMDLVLVTHDLLRVGVGGFVVSYDSGTKTAVLSERVAFQEGYTHKIILRSATGGINGAAITVFEGDEPNEVTLAEDPATALDFSPDQCPPLFAFGVASLEAFYGKVASVVPSGDNEVEITLVNYDARIYEWLEQEPAAYIPPVYIATPTAPKVTVVTLAFYDAGSTYTGLGLATWPAAEGALVYVVQHTEDDGDTWNPIAETASTSVQLDIVPGNNQVRVAARSLAGQGAWTESNVLVGACPGGTINENMVPEAMEDGSAQLDEDA